MQRRHPGAGREAPPGGGFLADLDALSRARTGMQWTMWEAEWGRLAEMTLDPDEAGDADLAAAWAEFIAQWDRGIRDLEAEADVVLPILERCHSYGATRESFPQNFQGIISRPDGPDVGMDYG